MIRSEFVAENKSPQTLQWRRRLQMSRSGTLEPKPGEEWVRKDHPDEVIHITRYEPGYMHWGCIYCHNGEETNTGSIHKDEIKKHYCPLEFLGFLNE